MKFARNALLVAAASAGRYQSATAFAPSSGIAAKAFGPRVFVPTEESSTSVAGVRTFLRRTFGSSTTTSTAGPDITKDEARYSFIYKFEDGEWKIAHHHSSVMPEAQLAGGSSGTTIEDAEVRSLFSLWNDALATLDPDKIAQRYSKSPCLLPTVSDTPRTDHESIKAYFVDFLQKKPQGKILESWVTSGPDWCMDDGIYEFEMGATGDKVKARYSFVYTLEGGEWKIAHHHSSQMPEEIVPKAMLEKAQAATTA